MSRDPRKQHLLLRGNVWHLNLPIPRELRSLYPTANGKHETHKRESLKTGDLAKAYELKFGRIDHWKREFARKRRRSSGSLAPDIQEAYEYREWLRKAVNDEDSGDHFEHLRDHAIERAEQIEDTAGPSAAQRWYSLATKYDRPTLQGAFREWIEESKHAAGTKLQYRHAFKEMMERAKLGGDAMPEHITRDHAKDYLRWLDTEANGPHGPLAYETKQVRLIALSSFWTHLVRNEFATTNPWEGLSHLLTGKKEPHKDAEDMKRGHSDAQLLQIINGPDVPASHRTNYPKRTLIELYALGSYTGARLNELCSLTLADVERKGHGYVIHIRKSKSAAGVRSLPVAHPIPVAVIKRRIDKRTDPKAQLFAEFKKGGVGKLSANVQKALGRYRDKVGIPPEVDFHSTRRDLLTRLEAAPGLSPLWIARYAGHTLPGVTFKVYAKVSPESLVKVANAIRYPAKVEAAYRRALGIK